MKMDIGLHQRQSLHQTMTLQLQEAIKLLQLSHEELEEYVEKQVTQNPFLESTPAKPVVHAAAGPKSYTSTDHSDSPRAYERATAPDKTLYEHLREQANTTFPQGSVEHAIAHEIIQYIDNTGLLSFECHIKTLHQRLKVKEAQVQGVLSRIQTFDPIGVGARNLEECLKIQLHEKGLFTPAFTVLLENLPLIAAEKLDQLMSLCKVKQDELQNMITELRKLIPCPGHSIAPLGNLYIIPEVIVRKGDNQDVWAVEINPATLHPLSFNTTYYAEVKKRTKNSQESQYLSSQLTHGNWLIKSIHQRRQTLIRVSAEIVSRQQDFLDKGLHFLKPLTLRDIASVLGIHESTVSRITTNKYIDTPRGVFELKFFFSKGFEREGGKSVSSESLRRQIQRLIANESAEHILSDEEIANILNERGTAIARRTVSKYREALDIPSSFQRKRHIKYTSS
jgi:RNA polymerase sigma-54 factor